MNIRSLIPVGRERSNVPASLAPFASLQHEIDRLFDDFGRNFFDFGRSFPGLPSLRSADFVPRMNVSETDKMIEISAELPGLEEKDVDINFADDMLTIRGERKEEKEEKDKDYKIFERSYGAFARSVALPPGTDPNKIKANIDKGVLKVTVEKPTPKVAKKIDVKAA
ncbi:MAG TPA: Hsp20/alpha crystallin family protein [Methylovirgula sp.]|nr:Hsp20/alpha crystallin family protein [Methylovirgula sp.]